MVYYCEDCLIENSQFAYIDFDVAGEDVNFDAVVTSPQDVLTLRLETVNKTTQPSGEVKKGLEVGKRMTRDRT